MQQEADLTELRAHEEVSVPTGRDYQIMFLCTFLSLALF